MRTTYRILASLIVVGVFLQAAFIAYAWFQALHDVDANGLVIAADYEGNAGHMLHGMIGTTVIPLLVIALLIVSFFAKVPRGVTFALVLFGLLLLQIVLAFASFAVPVLGALHGMNAIAIVGVAVTAANRARLPKREPEPEPAPVAPGAATA